MPIPISSRSDFSTKSLKATTPISASACAKFPAFTTSRCAGRGVDKFDDYAQILSYPMPPLELLAKGEQVEKYAKLVDDGFADI